MAAEDCRAGCLVVTVRSNKTWTHADNGTRLDLRGLMAMLDEEAGRLTAEPGGSIRLMAKGLDLRPRLKTERAATAKRKKSKPRRSVPKATKALKKKFAAKRRKPPAVGRVSANPARALFIVHGGDGWAKKKRRRTAPTKKKSRSKKAR